MIMGKKSKELYAQMHKNQKLISSLNENLCMVQSRLQLKKFLEHFNSKDEEIFSILYHNKQPFVITVELLYDITYNLLREISFYGYIPNSLYRENTLWATVSYCKNNGHITALTLMDNIGNIRNQGYGSLMMHAFLQYAKHLHVPKITGWLSPHDTQQENHKQLLYHFYQKFGFKISKRETDQVTYICLTLK